MTDPTIQLLSELRPIDPAPADELFSEREQTALLGRILSADTHGRRGHGLTRSAPRRRRRLLVPTLGTALAAGIGAIVLFTGSAVVHTPSAVAFSTAASGDIIATVTDPFAAQKELDAAFAAHGFNITVRLDPVSPSLVGTVVGGVPLSADPNSQIQALAGGKCIEGSAGCPIGIKIPATFTGTASITLGRPAQSGESYEAYLSAFSPGEVLHCSALLGAQVSTAVPVLAKDGETVTSWRVESTANGTTASQLVTTPPLDDYIWNIYPVAAGEVQVETEAAPLSTDPGLVKYDQQFSQGC